MQTQPKHENDYQSLDVILFILITLISLFIQFISLLWHFIQSLKKSQNHLDTLPSLKKKGQNSFRLKSTSIQKESSLEPSVPTLSMAASTVTSMASSSSTGNPSVLTKPKARRSRAGTKSQVTKTSKSGRSTQSVSPLVTTK